MGASGVPPSVAFVGQSVRCSQQSMAQHLLVAWLGTVGKQRGPTTGEQCKALGVHTR